MRLVLLCIFLVGGLVASAHTVPSMTLEAAFQADRSFEMRMSIDPRLFLSNNPTALPPVNAQWYHEQTEAQRQQTFAKATELLRHAVTLHFGTAALAWEKVTYQPMDGATNQPLGAESQEVHLLASMNGVVAGDEFSVSLASDANTSLVLLNSLGDKMERRPQVLFAGETSRPFKLPEVPKPVAASSPVIAASKQTAPVSNQSWLVIVCVASVTALIALARLVKRR